MDNPKYTSVGTNIDEVKKQNANSGLTYNELNELVAKTGNKGAAMYSNTKAEEIKRKNQPPVQ